MSDGAHKTESKISPTENMTGLFQLGVGHVTPEGMAGKEVQERMWDVATVNS